MIHLSAHGKSCGHNLKFISMKKLVVFILILALTALSTGIGVTWKARKYFPQEYLKCTDAQIELIIDEGREYLEYWVQTRYEGHDPVIEFFDIDYLCQYMLEDTPTFKTHARIEWKDAKNDDSLYVEGELLVHKTGNFLFPGYQITFEPDDSPQSTVRANNAEKFGRKIRKTVRGFWEGLSSD